ncbi:MAG: transposase [Desulfobacterales bacterium]|nr:transposase [Desulfobacterales bacterium]
MARIARAIAPGFPHHMTQRGNRRQQTFFSDADYDAYIDLMAKWCDHYGIDVWAYCLMPNHVHLIAVPQTQDAIRLAIGEAHRRYSRFINFREGWRGHLWQGRFASYVMDEPYLLACARYIENNPVRAKLVCKPENWVWSSAGAHIKGENDRLVKVEPLLKMIENNWSDFLSPALTKENAELLRRHERTGRPLGNEAFVERLEIKLGRNLRPQKPGRPKKG